ncbi:MAG TPA: molecular chaperone DnaJ [Actinomycetota bacterium]|nr:molecular chaperone DnaJ [Actinomycetota bacterium]
MAAVRDLYEILGIARDASPTEIKAAYRKLARTLHPDVNADPADQERFKEITGAYEILSDPTKRQRYDEFGAAGPQGAPFGDIQDIFDMFFGGGFGGRSRGPRSRVRRGEDLRIRVRLTFPESVFGVEQRLEIERLAACGRCGGSGARPGTSPVTCRTCGGAGEVQAVRRSIFGTVMTATPCVACGGTGEEIPDRCEECGGDGRVRTTATVTFDVPAGVLEGMDLRVGGEGNAGVSGGPAGDLIVGIEVEPSDAFIRQGQDLHGVLDVSITQATLGGELDVETLDGPERLRIEAGTESGTVLRLKGKGVPHLQRRGRGDLFVTLHIVTPRDLSKEERTLLQRFAEIRDSGGGSNGVAPRALRRPEYRP